MDAHNPEAHALALELISAFVDYGRGSPAFVAALDQVNATLTGKDGSFISNLVAELVSTGAGLAIGVAEAMRQEPGEWWANMKREIAERGAG